MKTHVLVPIIFATASFLLLYSPASSGAQDALPGPIEEKVAVFFEQVQKGEVQPAMEKLIAGSMIGSNPAQVQNLISQIINAINLYGPVHGFEFVEAGVPSESLCKSVWITKHPAFALRWSFIYYKAQAGWTLISIEFDDQLGELFS